MMNKDRLGVLIGKNGKTKRLIEKLTSTKIIIDSKTGEYRVEAVGRKEEEEPDEEVRFILDRLNLDEEHIDFGKGGHSVGKWIAEMIIDAINTGFAPEKALKLLNPEYSYEKIDLARELGLNEKRLRAIKGRIIGQNGVMREAIERYTGCHVSVYKDYVALIGDFEGLKIARKAINMILENASLKSVMSFLEKKYREKKEEEFKQIWRPSFE